MQSTPEPQLTLQQIARQIARKLWLPAVALSALTSSEFITYIGHAPTSYITSWVIYSLLCVAALMMQFVLASVYISIAILLLPACNSRWWFRPLQRTGRMSLSVYVGQSVLLGWIFHGYGLGAAATVGLAGGVLLSLGAHAALMVFATIWLARFRVGPLEWLVGSFVALRWLPMARRPISVTTGIAP